MLSHKKLVAARRYLANGNYNEFVTFVNEIIVSKSEKQAINNSQINTIIKYVEENNFEFVLQLLMEL